MPRNPIDYSKIVFYKLVCRDITITELYVGSTTDFRARKNHHKGSCQNEKNKSYSLKVYRFIREHGNFENWDMIIIHRQSCIDAHEAHTIERHYVETLGATLNCNIPSRTKTQYYHENIDTIKENHSEYRGLHKDITFEYNKKYYAANKEEILADQAEYYQLHRERIIETVQKYAENN